MKWLALSCFLMWARHGEGGALKCLPEDDACSSQLSKEVEQQEIDIRRPSSADAPAECLSGSEWESNCHKCRCVAGGAQCVRRPECDSIEEPVRCKPNTTFERDCNTCRCLENGLGICTIMECASVTTEAAPSKPIIPKGVDCAPGTTWQSQCNECVCSPEGRRYCTDKACPGHIIPKGVDCDPGTTWQSQCNECVCSPEGRRYCTDKACPGQETEPLLRCAPQSQWKNDCNMCWCNSGRAMCTKMGCVGIPSEMHFDDRKGDPEAVDIPEPNDLPEVPDLNSNDILESDAKDQHISENLDLDTNTDLTEDLTGVHLKELEDFDHNDVDTPIQIPDQVMTDFAANNSTNVLGEDLELLEALLNDKTKGKTDEQTSDNSKVKVDKITEEEKAASDIVTENKDVEILDDSYINQSETDHRVKRSACKPNEDFLDDCNTCKCSETGQSYSCTQNECMDKDGKDGGKDVDKEVEVFMENEGVDHIERHSVCKPSTTFYVGCNPCHCNSAGTDFTCTNKPCPLPEDVEVFHELHAPKSAKNATKKVCVENRMFIMNCNTCWCNEDGTSYFCTRKVCVNTDEPVVEEGTEQKLRIVKKECRPGEVFEIDCNMCHCNPDGKSYSCTRRACFDEKNQTVIRKTRATPQEAPKNCQPGQEFRMDCNKCLCDNEGQNFSCTRIDCTALNNNNNNGNRRKRDASQKVSADCVPGSVFEQGCNVCRCTEDGGHATCTLKRCQSKENATLTGEWLQRVPLHQDGGHATCTLKRCQSKENATLTGECCMFEQGCNVCRCTEDGGHATCTLKRCQSKKNATLTATESSFRCNPGEQFKQSCNDCSCSADGKSVFCTLLVCDDELSP
ncbi:uncharacterized protein LOC134674194 [Cydia fagiglandana]|uniref:uncharacterized protein LOC134674194 n=1 Tax=Cydia fagiglandana TaxID=1458189 RepID=UPI002FEE3F16